MNIQQVRCASIIEKKRFRKDIGPISDLAESMKDIGLLQPIMVRADNLHLIFGARRLAAANRLNWDTIPCILVNPDELDTLVAEQDENVHRKEFTTTEKVAIAKAIEDREREKAKERKAASQVQNSPRNEKGQKESAGSGNLPAPGETTENTRENGESAQKAAAAVGMSRKTYNMAKDVVEAAEKDPAMAEVAAKMDETGNVSGAHREMQQKSGKSPRKKTWDKKKWKSAFGAFQRACDGIKLMSRKTSLGCTVQECLEAILTASKGA